MECRRVLKDAGSIYLHCDPTANHYVKMLMDCAFGKGNFRNEIIWCYTGPSNTKRDFPRKHDTILRYVNGRDWTFNADEVRVQYADSSIGSPMHSANKPTVMRGAAIRLQDGGKVPPTVWTDIQQSYKYCAERIGYPTQKPLKLYERIIRASSNPGDDILDTFCDCAATICVEAEMLGRGWIGIDVWPNMVGVAMDMLKRECWSGAGARPNTTAPRDEVFVNEGAPARTVC